jgi:geranylgeranyl diphosphate synthase type I
MDLTQELQRRVTIFNDGLASFLAEGSPTMLYDAARHLPMAGGKRLRPVIAMLSCEAVGGNPTQVLPFAIALELIHNFTLIHDDIMDSSHLRRNIPTVHIKYGHPTAILAGDLLFSKAFEAMHKLSSDDATFKKVEYSLTQVIREICEGQQLDMEYEQQPVVSVDAYMEMIRKKTAVLFQCSSGGGARVGGGSSKTIDALETYGEAFGLAFQIQDDYLDMSSNVETLGKDIGNDIRNGKKTLIAVHSLTHATGQEKKLLQSIFGNKQASDEDIQKVFHLFQELHSVDYARETALRHNARAKEALEEVDASQTRDILSELADYAIQRKK